MTYRLIGLSAQHWPSFDGEWASGGQDPLTFPIDRFLNVVYWWATRNADEDELRKFEIRLWQPPPGEVPESGPWTAEAESSAFKAFSAQVKGPDTADGMAGIAPRQPTT